MLNNVSLVGRLTKNPEVNKTNNGLTYAKFNLAVQRNYVKKDGKVDTDFIPCMAWGKNAENISNTLTKGSFISIEGSIATSNYQNSKGQNKFTMNVNVGSFNYLEHKSANKSSASNSNRSKRFQSNNLNSKVPTPSNYKQETTPSNYNQEAQLNNSQNIRKQPIIDDPNTVNKIGSFDNMMSNQNSDFSNQRFSQNNFENKKSNNIGNNIGNSIGNNTGNNIGNNISNNDNDNDQYFPNQFNVGDGDIPF